MRQRSLNGTYVLADLDPADRQQVLDRLAQANAAWWGLVVTDWELVVKRYAIGDEHAEHQDLHAGAAGRKLAGVVQLSQDDAYSGGDLLCTSCSSDAQPAGATRPCPPPPSGITSLRRQRRRAARQRRRRAQLLPARLPAALAHRPDGQRLPDPHRRPARQARGPQHHPRLHSDLPGAGVRPVREVPRPPPSRATQRGVPAPPTNSPSSASTSASAESSSATASALTAPAASASTLAPAATC